MTDPGWMILLSAMAGALSLTSMIRLHEDLGKAVKDRRWREAIGHVRTGKMSMETLMRKSIQGRIGRP